MSTPPCTTLCATLCIGATALLDRRIPNNSLSPILPLNAPLIIYSTLKCFSPCLLQQGCCLILLNMIILQPEAVQWSHWARHWACAVDVLELLAAESAFTRATARIVEEGDRELVMGVMDDTDVKLKDAVFKLMDDQYRPGEQYKLSEQYMPFEQYISGGRYT